MSTFSNAMKVCATCTRWDGEREVGMIVPAYFVDVQNAAAKGRCMGGGYFNQEMSAMATCGKYIKWPALK